LFGRAMYQVAKATGKAEESEGGAARNQGRCTLYHPSKRRYGMASQRRSPSWLATLGVPAVSVIGVFVAGAGAQPLQLGWVRLPGRQSPLYWNITAIGQPPGEHRRMYLADDHGRIWVVRDGQALETPFLDIAAQLPTSGAALVGMAFHPGFATNGSVYVCYTL